MLVLSLLILDYSKVFHLSINLLLGLFMQREFLLRKLCYIHGNIKIKCLTVIILGIELYWSIRYRQLELVFENDLLR